MQSFSTPKQWFPKLFSSKSGSTLLALAVMVGVAMPLGLHDANAAGLADLFDDNSSTTTNADFLKVDDAFTVVAIPKDNQLQVNIEITPGHYVYKDKLKLNLPDGIKHSGFTFSQSFHTINDPNFGKVAIFDQPNVTATTTLNNTTSKAIAAPATLRWQGCAKAGLCYPPQKVLLNLNVPAPNSVVTNKTESKITQAKSVDSSKGSIATDKAGNEPKIISTTNNSISKDIAGSKESTIKNKAATASSTDAEKTPNTATDKQNVNVDGVVANDSASNSATSISTNNQAELLGITDSKNTDINNSDDSSNSANADIDINATESIGDTGAITALDESETINLATTDNVGITTVDSASLINNGNSQNNDVSELNLSGSVEEDFFGLTRHFPLALVLLFLAGLVLSFTACVLPMLPIVSNIVASQNNASAKRGFILSSSYGLGVAVAYGLLGAAIAVFGQALGLIGWLQNPIVLITFATIFIVLSLFMLEAFTIKAPKFIRQNMHKVNQAGDKYLGSLGGSFIAGLLSALVVSPCVSPALSGALLAVATIGSPLKGFAALFMLGFGVSAPLILFGAGQGHIMPKAGAWMDWVKRGLALALFGIALMLIARILISPIMLIIWAIWGFVLVHWLWSWQGRGIGFTRALAGILGIWSLSLAVGAAAGSQNALRPLAIFTQTTPISNSNTGIGNSELSNYAQKKAQSTVTITRVDDLLPIINSTPKVLVDVTADWCVECRIMDNTLFNQPPATLSDWQVVKLDVTDTNADSTRVLSELKLFGPPALLYFVDGGLKQRQIGTVSRSDFESTLVSF